MTESTLQELKSALFPLSRGVWREYIKKVAELLLFLGTISDNSFTLLKFALKKKISKDHYFEEASFIGLGALSVAIILTLFSGMVIALQVAKELVKQGAGNYVGALVSVSILRELAPVLTGFAVIALNGSAYAAQLGTMSIQKEIDAMRVLQVNPLRYLVLPKVLAAVTMMPFLTVISAISGIMGGSMVSYYLADLNYSVFMESVWAHTSTSDLLGAMLKASVFGFIIVLISTTYGLMTKDNAREVGQNTQKAVVWSFIAIAIADFVLSFILFNGKF